MRFCGRALLLIIACVVPAQAEGPDCARVATPLDRAICADPDLLAVAQRVEALSRGLVTAPWAAETARDHDIFLNMLPRRAANPEALRATYRERLQTLDRERLMAADPRLRAWLEDMPAYDCLILPISIYADAPCRAVDQGALGTLEGRARSYVLYAYEGSDTGALILLGAGSGEGAARVELIAFSWDERCERPWMLPGPVPALLWRCVMASSGSARRDRVWRPERDGWRERDVQSWRADLQARLDRQYALHRPPIVDFDAMRTVVRLRAQGDGVAPWVEVRIALGWDGDRLVMRGLEIVQIRD